MRETRVRDAERSRGLILDAAESAFAENGYEGATFSDICASAGVSRGLPIYVFGSKAALYRAVVERAADDLRRSVFEPLRRSKSRSLKGALEQGVSTYLSYLSRNPQIVRLLQWEMLAREHRDRPFAPSSQLFGELVEILQPAFDQGGRSISDARRVVSFVVSLCFFPFVSGGLRALDDTPSGSDYIARRTREIMQLLQKGVL